MDDLTSITPTSNTAYQVINDFDTFNWEKFNFGLVPRSLIQLMDAHFADNGRISTGVS